MKNQNTDSEVNIISEKNNKYNTINNIAQNIKLYTIMAAMILLGWFARYTYDNINIQPISYKTNENISYALDERGRLHVVDLTNQKTVIYSDSVALGINAQVSSRIYQDYLNKTKGEK